MPSALCPLPCLPSVDEAALSPGKRAWWQQQVASWGWLDSLPPPETAWIFYALHKAHDRAG